MVEEYFSRYRGIRVKLLASPSRWKAGPPAPSSTFPFTAGWRRRCKAVGFGGGGTGFLCSAKTASGWSQARWETIPWKPVPGILKMLRELFPNL
jgi:hypothetical protein